MLWSVDGVTWVAFEPNAESSCAEVSIWDNP
ncbi:MAG: hypothetical protein RL068_992 [Actinomycetota bacterium]|jgi:hypothetical protein